MDTRKNILVAAVLLMLATPAFAVLGTPDGATFTDGTSGFLGPTGGEFNDSAGTVASGKAGACRITSKRALHVNLRDNSGNEEGTSASPLFVKPTDGTNAATIKAASTPPATTDTALVTTDSPVANPVCTSFIALSQTAGTKVVAGVSGKKIYICSILIVANAAETVSLIEGTGTVCATGGTAIYGSTTAANGMSFAANGGFAQAAARPFLVTSTNTDDLCVIQNGSSRVTGGISYSIQ
jgi:hypothetical protein